MAGKKEWVQNENGDWVEVEVSETYKTTGLPAGYRQDSEGNISRKVTQRQTDEFGNVRVSEAWQPLTSEEMNALNRTGSTANTSTTLDDLKALLAANEITPEQYQAAVSKRILQESSGGGGAGRDPSSIAEAWARIAIDQQQLELQRQVADRNYALAERGQNFDEMKFWETQNISLDQFEKSLTFQREKLTRDEALTREQWAAQGKEKEFDRQLQKALQTQSETFKEKESEKDRALAREELALKYADKTDLRLKGFLEGAEKASSYAGSGYAPGQIAGPLADEAIATARDNAAKYGPQPTGSPTSYSQLSGPTTVHPRITNDPLAKVPVDYEAASGLNTVVDEPTLIRAGEGGQKERVLVEPLPDFKGEGTELPNNAPNPFLPGGGMQVDLRPRRPGVGGLSQAATAPLGGETNALAARRAQLNFDLRGGGLPPADFQRELNAGRIGPFSQPGQEFMDRRQQINAALSGAPQEAQAEASPFLPGGNMQADLRSRAGRALAIGFLRALAGV